MVSPARPFSAWGGRLVKSCDGPAVSVPSGQSLLAASHFPDTSVNEASAHSGTADFIWGLRWHPGSGEAAPARPAEPAGKCNIAI